MAGKPALTRLEGFLGSRHALLSPPLPPPRRLGRLHSMSLAGTLESESWWSDFA